MKKYLFSVIIAVFIAVFPLYAENTVNVELTSIKTREITVSAPVKIIDPNTMQIYVPENSAHITLNGKKLVFRHNNNIFSSSVYMLVSDSDLIRFRAGKRDYAYKGSLTLTASENIKITNKVKAEDYVRNVLTGEFSSKAPLESVKAQAVAIRTYVINKINRKDTHLCDTNHCQVYTGYIPNDIFGKAVAQTKGEILTYKDSPISAMYCTDCGGISGDWTEEHGTVFPYLASVSDPVPISHIKWEYRIREADLSRRLGISPILSYECETFSSGRIRNITFFSNTDKKTFTGEKIRSLLNASNIKSTLFCLEKKDDFFVFSGFGYGHGFGMCQKSAIELGKNGWTYRKILAYYYKNTKIKKIY